MRTRSPISRPKRGFLAVLGVIGLLAVSHAVSAQVADRLLVEECHAALERWEAGRALRTAEQLMERYPDEPAVLALVAQAEFLSGRYAATRKHLEAMKEAGESPPEHLARITGKLKDLHESFEETGSEHFRLRWARPVDGIMAEYAMEVLEKALDSLCTTLRWSPPERPILVEIYPDTETFATATTLSMEEINTSGAVAICKFNRVMITSPRLYLQGYRWADTLAHELTHYVLIRKTGHDIPVWLHEGTAKYCETLWRSGSSSSRLTPMQATLLAEAREGDRFISFDRMHTSLVKLDSSEEVALAYAEVVSFIHFLHDLRGESSLPDLIDRVAAGEKIQDVLRDMGGMEFDALYARWKKWLGEQKLDRIPGLRVLPRKLSEGQDNTGRTADLSGMLPDEAYRFVRLGDMLRDQSRPAAAAIEYRKGAGRTDYISPHLQVRLARMEVRSGQLDSAQRTLRKMARYYPDHLPLYLTRSELLQNRRQYQEATRALETAAHINPFDPRVHQQLGTLYGLTGQKDKRRREERVLRRIYEWLKW